MISDTALSQLRTQLGQIEQFVAVAGGDSNQAFRVFTKTGQIFLKWTGTPVPGAMQSEALGLQNIRAAGCKAPQVIDSFEDETGAYLALEWIDLQSRGSDVEVATSLASLHGLQSDTFGWSTPSALGLVAQPAIQATSFDAFFRNRIETLTRAAGRHLDNTLVERMDAVLNALSFTAHGIESPEFVHGDFWGGNHGFTQDGVPVFFDPSPIFACGAYDLAFALFFRCFDHRMLDAYFEIRPEMRASIPILPILQLPIALVHVAMFGRQHCVQLEHIVSAGEALL